MNQDLMEKINLGEGLKEKLSALYQSDEKQIKALAEKCKADGNFRCLAFKNDVMRLAVCLAYAEYTKEEYLEKGIPLSVFYDTMADIKIWCENNNNKGLKNYRWIENHLKCNLFRIGRLQFQMFNCTIKTLDYKRLPFAYNDKMIYIHIPQGEKLVYNECIEAINKAREFFDIYFSDFNYEFFFCESWLLYDENWQFMKAGSNILQFQTLFDIVYSSDSDSQAIERIFGKRHLIKTLYPEKTSLQKSAKSHILKGNKLGIGIGIIEK